MLIKVCKRLLNANRKGTERITKGGDRWRAEREYPTSKHPRRTEQIDLGEKKETVTTKEMTGICFDPPLKESEELPSYIQPNSGRENWSEEWETPMNKEKKTTTREDSGDTLWNEKKSSSLDSNYAYTIPYKFKITIPEKLSGGKEPASQKKIKEYSRDVSADLHYTDFCGFRNPTLSTFNNYRYWNDTGFKKFMNRIFPIKLPEHKKIDPLLREYIYFLHSFDPYRFSFKRLSERYYFSEKTIKNIYREESVKKFLRENDLCDETTKRITKKEAILKIKELIYSKKVGYKQFGDFENAKVDEEDKFMGHKNTFDHINRQIIEVESLSAFPLPGRRNPVPKRVDVDMTVHNSANVKIMNWINPNDRVVF